VPQFWRRDQHTAGRRGGL